MRDGILLYLGLFLGKVAGDDTAPGSQENQITDHQGFEIWSMAILNRLSFQDSAKHVSLQYVSDSTQGGKRLRSQYIRIQSKPHSEHG